MSGCLRQVLLYYQFPHPTTSLTKPMAISPSQYSTWTMLHANKTWLLTNLNLQHLQCKDMAIMIRQICNITPEDVAIIRSRELLRILTREGFAHQGGGRGVRKKSYENDQLALFANWGKLFMLFYVCWLFSKSTFSKNSLRNTIRVSNSFDPDQTRHFVGPGLGLNCLQRLSADDTNFNN